MAQTLMEQQSISSALQAIRSAQNILTDQISASTDPQSAIKLTNAYRHLSSCLSQLLLLKNVTDDATFSESVAMIKAQTSNLQSDEHMIKGLVADLDTAEEVVGYIGQVLSFIAKIG